LRAEAAAPKLDTMTPEEIYRGLASATGTIARGQHLVTALGCTACHTVSASEPPKGPFLGSIANIMTRQQIAQAIVEPNATISQGFATYSIELQDGTSVVGFIVQEATDATTVRNVAGQEMRIPTARITGRTRLPVSLMPAGLVAG